jgi:hypothetical protein
MEINLATNVITNFIKAKFGCDPMALQLLSSFVIKGLTSLEEYAKNFDFNTIDISKESLIFEYIKKIGDYQKYLCILFIFIYFSYYKSLYIQKVQCIYNYMNCKPITKICTNNNSNKYRYYQINISNRPTLITCVNKFMTLKPNFFNTTINKSIVSYSGKLLNIFQQPVYFKDDIHNIEGYITTQFTDVSSEKDATQNYGMIINIKELMSVVEKDENNNIIQPTNLHIGSSKQCYMSQIENYVKHNSEHGNYILLNYYKVLSNNLVEYIFYENNISTWESDVKLLQKEFFSIHKKYLFSIMNEKLTNRMETDNGWNNMILYGPPGTGKSSFVYRIAVMLKMDIISIDLSLYMDRKRELFAIFHGQTFGMPNNTNVKHTMQNKYIIILDEFDTCMERLIEIERINEYKKEITNKHFNKGQEFISNNVVDNPQKQPQKTKPPQNPKPNPPQKTKPRSVDNHIDCEEFNMEDYMTQEMNAENDENYENKVECSTTTTNNDTPSQTKKKENRKFTEDIMTINGEISFVVKSINDDNKSDLLHISDLLELFQGPVPVKNRMIVATTNHYDKIKNELPALFRAGRMTPLEFTYIDWDSFIELCKYHFDKTPECEPMKICMPTSEIIELVEKYKIYDNFNEFVTIVTSKNDKL